MAAKPHNGSTLPQLAELDEWRLFSPTLDDSGTAYQALRKAVSLGPDRVANRLVEIAAAADDDSLDSLRTRAAALLLRDLVAMGWSTRVKRHFIEIRPPHSHGLPSKDAIRRQLEFGRDDQLREPATRRFIIGLERPSRFSNCRPVTDLIADGRRLARQLQPVAGLPKDERSEVLSRICHPYLQLVDADTIDQHTGIRLMDIWRYFRHSWATRYRSSPGRNLFYLIRDAGQPYHPVMAITALGNTVMQLGVRDRMLGWTIVGLQHLLSQKTFTEDELLHAFRHRLEADFKQIYTSDLPVPRALSKAISDDVLDRLRIIEEQAVDARTARLKDTDDEDAVPPRVDDVSEADLKALAQTPLFRAKRARAARDILKALRELRHARSFSALLARQDGEWAVNQVIRQVKKQFSATSIMEITVCGGVAPYNHLLAGKLACLMMMSPRVVTDYAERYDGGYSIIASQMAARPIIKTPTLAFLGTSSLYTQRSSQYNRVELPPAHLPGQTMALRYLELGISQGYGSPNLSSETEAALETLGEATREYRNVNFVFGEGQSPKLRRLREAFDSLGLRRTNILHHASSRIIYGVPLAQNTTRFLLGIDDQPKYALPASADADDRIAAFWRSRWLASRLDHAPALAAVAGSSPMTERVARLMPPAPHGKQTDLFDAHEVQKDRAMRQPAKEDEKVAFIRNLYRDENAYSDHVKIGRLRELNVKTRLDEVVRKIVRAGGSVVITGNAGDGKTHTIRLLESDLKEANAHVIVDASEIAQEQVLSEWVEAKRTGQPFCIAINEGPLIELIRTYRTTHPWLEDIRLDLLKLVRYVPVERAIDDKFQPEPGKTVVIDLSLRRTLSPDLVKRIIGKLTDDGWYSGCGVCPSQGSCPVKYNCAMLRETSVQSRLVALLDRVAERGMRATFREVLAFGSFLIFGGRTCSELLAEAHSEQSRYYWHAFEGQGAIFENLQLGLDPIRQTMARVDEDLWHGRYQAESFLGHQLMPAMVRNFDEMQEHEASQAAAGFAAIKRRWYFEHPEGCLGMPPHADRVFQELQNASLTPQLRAGRLIAHVNRWWNRRDRDQQESLRLWTRLSYSPRAQGRAMVSGRDVSSLKLTLFKPTLTPALQAAFGDTTIDHLLFGPPDNLRFASLMVDRRLIAALLAHGVSEHERSIERQLEQFNDALAQHAEADPHVRTIELLDPESELQVKIRVDLNQRRYDSAH